jgi:hypothetical protein
MARRRIQIILAGTDVPEGLKSALCRADASVSFWSPAEALRADPALEADALVIVLPADTSGLGPLIRALFDRLAEHPRATLLLTPGREPASRPPHPACLPVICAAGDNEHDLALQLGMLLEMRDALESLHRGLLANRRSGETVAQRYLNQLRLASQVQRGFLPEALPHYGPVSFDVLFRPIDFVSGDIYDLHRLDEHHVGIALADASGHGIPAALMTVYIKRALRGKEIDSGSYRILPPDEVLKGLNRDILDARLSECPFVAAVYAVLNTRTLELRLARGGAPYPIYRAACGNLRLLESAGSVVGVMPDAHFAVTSLRLHPGDSLLIYSDGLEHVLAPELPAAEDPRPLRAPAARVGRSGEMAQETGVSVSDLAGRNPRSKAVAAVAGAADAEPPHSASGSAPPAVAAATRPARPGPAPLLRATHNLIRNSSWYATLQREGPAAALAQLSSRQRALRRLGYPLDDLSVLAVNVAY